MPKAPAEEIYINGFRYTLNEKKGKEMFINRKCGTCYYHKVDNMGEWYCGNQRSDHYCEYTDYNDDCIDWHERAERRLKSEEDSDTVY